MATKLSLKKENYTAVSDFLLVSFERDLEDFTKVFKTINEDYLKGFKVAIEEVRKINSVVPKLELRKQTTKSLYLKVQELKDRFALLKLYAKRSKVEVPMLKEVIEALKKKNIERVVHILRSIRDVLKKVSVDISDMPEGYLDDIPTIIEEMEKLNLKQNIYFNEGKRETEKATVLYANLYKYIKEIAESGKIIYKGSPKIDEYTISKILSRVTRKKEK